MIEKQGMEEKGILFYFISLMFACIHKRPHFDCVPERHGIHHEIQYSCTRETL